MWAEIKASRDGRTLDHRGWSIEVEVSWAKSSYAMKAEKEGF